MNYFEEPDEDDVEMTADENTEMLPASLDVAAVMIEALSLALPPFPRKDGAALGEAVFADKDVARALENSFLAERHVINMSSPNITSRTPLDKEHLWYNPYKK